MATFSGRGGNVTFGSERTNIRSWMLRTEAIAVPTVTEYTTSNWIVHKSGDQRWTGTYMFYQQTTGHGVTIGQENALTLTDGNVSYSGTAIITNVSYQVDIEGAELVSGSVEFTGAGALTIS